MAYARYAEVSQQRSAVMEKNPAVYIMASKRNGTLYVGVTGDLGKRVWEHKCGVFSGFTHEYGVKLLVWYEMHEVFESAFVRETRIKNWKRLWKLRLIEERNPDWLDLAHEVGVKVDGDS
jgi:putative endonuclease